MEGCCCFAICEEWKADSQFNNSRGRLARTLSLWQDPKWLVRIWLGPHHRSLLGLLAGTSFFSGDTNNDAVLDVIRPWAWYNFRHDVVLDVVAALLHDTKSLYSCTGRDTVSGVLVCQVWCSFRIDYSPRRDAGLGMIQILSQSKNQEYNMPFGIWIAHRMNFLSTM